VLPQHWWSSTPTAASEQLFQIRLIDSAAPFDQLG
jgi:hypothetical protein